MNICPHFSVPQQVNAHSASAQFNSSRHAFLPLLYVRTRKSITQHILGHGYCSATFLFSLFNSLLFTYHHTMYKKNLLFRHYSLLSLFNLWSIRESYPFINLTSHYLLHFTFLLSSSHLHIQDYNTIQMVTKFILHVQVFSVSLWHRSSLPKLSDTKSGSSLQPIFDVFI